VDTMATNTAMLRAAERAGFRREAVLREAEVLARHRVDTVVLGLLTEEWEAGRAAR
jgi:RimJ/RimL family protein N-acetyltransferase